MSEVLRMSLELARDEDSALYDELAALPKGRKRLNRLRTLAHIGLRLSGAPAAASTTLPPPVQPPEHNTRSAALADLLSPIDEQ